MTDLLLPLIGLMVTAIAVALGGLILEAVLKIIGRTINRPMPDPPGAVPVSYAGRRNEATRKAA